MDNIKRSCCIICNNAEPTLHRFPRDEKRLREWLAAIQKTSLLESHGSSIVYNSGRLCNAHFEEKYFCGKDKKKLLKNAVPSVSISVKPYSLRTRDRNTDKNDDAKTVSKKGSSKASPSVELVTSENAEPSDKLEEKSTKEEENTSTNEEDCSAPTKEEKSAAPIKEEESTGECNTEATKELIEKNILHASKSRKKAEKIIGATRITGELLYLVKWEGGIEGDVLPSTFVRQRYPQQLIQFLEDRLEWTTPSGQKESGTA